MPEYRFEIQNCIKVRVDAENQLDARMQVCENLHRYANEMVRDPYVSEGEVIE